jgi:hypothetical protein|tara:strand:+ start:2779 stop:2961 length:183 start_codon:yes stop_codon:yes gene_type:complete
MNSLSESNYYSAAGVETLHEIFLNRDTAKKYLESVAGDYSLYRIEQRKVKTKKYLDEKIE